MPAGCEAAPKAELAAAKAAADEAAAPRERLAADEPAATEAVALHAKEAAQSEAAAGLQAQLAAARDEAAQVRRLDAAKILRLEVLWLPYRQQARKHVRHLPAMHSLHFHRFAALSSTGPRLKTRKFLHSLPAGCVTRRQPGLAAGGAQGAGAGAQRPGSRGAGGRRGAAQVSSRSEECNSLPLDVLRASLLPVVLLFAATTSGDQGKSRLSPGHPSLACFSHYASWFAST